MNAVAHIPLPQWQLPFNHGVTTLHDVDVERIVEHRAVIVVLDCHARECAEAVEAGNQVGIELNGRDILAHGVHKLIKQLLLEHLNAIFCTDNLLLIVLQLLSHIALGAHKRLLANPLLRHLCLVGVSHLDVVAKHIVKTDFQARNARDFALALLHLHEIVLA